MRYILCKCLSIVFNVKLSNLCQRDTEFDLVCVNVPVCPQYNYDTVGCQDGHLACKKLSAVRELRTYLNSVLHHPLAATTSSIVFCCIEIQKGLKFWNRVNQDVLEIGQ